MEGALMLFYLHWVLIELFLNNYELINIRQLVDLNQGHTNSSR